MNATSQALITLPQSSNPDIRPMVENELGRILAHALFKDTTRMKRFLTYVVTESLEGREKRLKGYAIGLEVFDRPEDFDPQGDTIVRVQAGQLRRRLDLFYADEGNDSEVRIIIPKGRYAPVFEIRHKADKDETVSKDISTAHAGTPNRPGIAVLTFQNLTPSDEQSFFAEGITAEIINALVQFRYLRMVARSATVFNDSQAPADLKKLADEYNVQFALTGNVRRAGSLMRVSVNLIAVKTGEHVYSKIFDCEYTPENIFEIQEEIASYIAASVAAPFGAVNRYNRRSNLARLESLSSYEAFLKYYDLSISPSTANMTKLLETFEQVVEASPRFSSAWAVISLLNTFLVTQKIPSSDPEKRLPAALEAAKKAVMINPENALAYSAYFRASYHIGDLDHAEDMASKAIILNPNDYNMLAYFAITSAFRGNYERARSFQKAALELVARPPDWFYTSSLICDFAERKYESVLSNIGTFTRSSAVGVQLIGLSCLGHMLHEKEASAFLKSVGERHDDYAADALKTIKHSYLDPDLYARLIEGWRKAGLDIPD